MKEQGSMRTMETGDDLERLLLVLVVVQVQLQHNLLQLATTVPGQQQDAKSEEISS
jgi:hypothetical protein